MTADEAIGILTGAQTMVLNRDPDKFVQAVNRAILALDSERQRKDPQPLTIEELRKMDGEPVYIVGPYKDSGWEIFVGHNDYCFWRNDQVAYHGSRYGETWIAYRHKPKEG